MENQCVFCSVPIPEVRDGQSVHVDCGRDHNRPADVAVALNEIEIAPPEVIDLKSKCFFCGCTATYTDAKKRGFLVHQVMNPYFQTNVEEIISSRNDQWAFEVKSRIGARNLILEKSMYHQNCNTNFQNFKSIPSSKGAKKSKKVGRPPDVLKNIAFTKLVEHIENNRERVFEIKELSDLMERENQECDEVIENRFVKKKLLSHYGDEIMVISNEGKSDMILFRDSLKQIINHFYNQQKMNDIQSDKQRLIQSVAKIIKDDVSLIPSNKDVYPSAQSLSNLELQRNFLPNALYDLLDEMFVEKDRVLKVVSIGQAIIQAIRPKSIIAPLQFGLAVQMHHNFGSKSLVMTLSNLGLCSSYWETKKFEMCAAATFNEIIASPNQIIKFVADNLDHNSRTIDGLGTFHGMGIIGAFTPARPSVKPVLRTCATIEDVRAIGRIAIQNYSKDLTESHLRYEKLPDDKYKNLNVNIDVLLKISYSHRSARPSWSGIMQAISHGSHPGKSSISILPLIDLSPSDPTCIYSTLIYVSKEAKKLNVTPVLTFDEPLWWKAQVIIQNEPSFSDLKSIVLLLGGFHMKMNFLGVIGFLMTETGLQECLETVYAPNSVKHMFSGKAVSRAIRGHFLVDTALNSILTTKTAPEHLPNENWTDISTKAASLYDNIVSLEEPVDELHSNEFLTSVRSKLDLVKTKLTGHRTAKLWLQYMEMIDIIRDFTRAERTGNWLLHLCIVRRMLPYFAAAGHHLYTKCGYLYLQQMHRLETDHRDVYTNFMSGHHVIRRSDRYWAGLSCDLTIEQYLMRAAKSQKGMTRGRGIKEDQRLVWVQSMPACSEINMSMQHITNLYFETSEQHKDCSEARQNRDEKDVKLIQEFLQTRDPFATECKSLCNIYTGEEARKNVNLDEAVNIGNKVISKLADKKVSEYTFKAIDKAITMGFKNAVVIDGEAVVIDPEVLFQRLILISRKLDEEKFKDAFKFELSQNPSSLFDDRGFLREEKTNGLVNEITKMFGKDIKATANSEEIYHYVLSGDTFLKRITWKKNESYRDICIKYMQYALTFTHPVIIFDDTVDLSTKDEVDFRQNKGACSAKIMFKEDTIFSSKKDSFLCNKSNKQRFITMLAKVLIENGCTIMFGDEDKFTAETAATMALNENVIVVSDNEDLAILLCYYCSNNSKDLILRSGSTRKKTSEWNIAIMKGKLDEVNPNHLLFTHAIGGCKGTSHLYGIGKSVALKMLMKNDEFRIISSIFQDKTSKPKVLLEEGCRALLLLYNGRAGETLDSLRHRLFEEKVSSKANVLVHSLPPTTAAAKYHLLRVFLQIQTWMGNILNPEDYGWTKKDRFRPRKTDLPPAPQELLKTIRCTCQGNCDTLRCNCFKNNMKCTSACSRCRGMTCHSSEPMNLEDDDDLSEYEFE